MRLLDRLLSFLRPVPSTTMIPDEDQEPNVPDTDTPEVPPSDADPADEAVPSEGAPPAPEAPAPPPPQPMSTEEVLTALEAQLAAIDLPTVDSESAQKWLNDFRVPLASMTTNAIVGLMQSRLAPDSDAKLEETLAALSPEELQQVLEANVAELERITDERVREVAMMRSTRNLLTNAASSILMGALLKVVGVPPATTA